jgi:release factor glutamine methyltransferase
MNERSWTLIDLLNTACRYLEEKEIENPRRNAEAMLGKVLGLPRIELYLQHDRPLSAEQVNAFRELTKRRVRHEPLQLILGTVEFFGVTLDVRPGLLIPRPETEELAEHLAREMTIRSAHGSLRMLDIGCGTGCLSVSLAAEIPHLSVDAADVDYDAVRCTSQNADLNGVASRVRALQADIFSDRFLRAVSPPYDAVVSNPPYVTEEDYAGLAPEVREHESRRALVAADGGLAFYRRIADLLPTLLKPEGFLAVEIGAGQEASIYEIFRDLLSPLAVHRDLRGIPRIVTGQITVKQTSNIQLS